jgi:hypothetical protein
LRGADDCLLSFCRILTEMRHASISRKMLDQRMLLSKGLIGMDMGAPGGKLTVTLPVSEITGKYSMPQSSLQYTPCRHPWGLNALTPSVLQAVKAAKLSRTERWLRTCQKIRDAGNTLSPSKSTQKVRLSSPVGARQCECAGETGFKWSKPVTAPLVEVPPKEILSAERLILTRMASFGRDRYSKVHTHDERRSTVLVWRREIGPRNTM